MEDKTIFQTEHINKENGTHYYMQYFTTISIDRLDIEDYIEIKSKLDELIKEYNNGRK